MEVEVGEQVQYEISPDLISITITQVKFLIGLKVLTSRQNSVLCRGSRGIHDMEPNNLHAASMKIQWRGKQANLSDCVKH
jgi:hypothetical protein